MGSNASIAAKAPISTDVNTFFQYDAGKGPWFKCLPDEEMPPRASQTGQCAMAPTTLPLLIKKAAETKGDRALYKVERPVPPIGTDGKTVPPALDEINWTKWTVKSAYDEIANAAKGMIALGFKRFDSLNVWGFNSPEWIMGALAASCAGGKVAGLYPTDTSDTAAYKVVHSGGSILLVEDRKKVTTIAAALKENGKATQVKAIVAWGFEPEKDEKVEIAGCGAVPLLSWKVLVSMGAEQDGAEMESRIQSTKPGHCAALIYTSGTTGDPKAVMISHDNIIYEASTVITTLSQSCGVCSSAEDERILSYLPLSHVAGMMVDIVCPIVGAALTPSYITVFFARNYDLKTGTLKDRLCVAKPTLFLGVPLVWEKVADKLRAIGAETTGLKKNIADWAKGLALDHSRACLMGGDGHYPFGYTMADKIVLSQIKGKLGLDCCKFGFTGAAPIRVDTLEYFGSLGLGINEVYGMSECTGACTFSLNEAHAWGSCGFELPGVEVRAFKVSETDFNEKKLCPPAPNLETIDEEFMGELCFRGRNIMMGYMANPLLGDDHVKEITKKTSETIDSEGWLHSGDKGLITTLGMVKITGRYKELIIGDGGENIAPVPIEDHVKKTCDGINEVMMVGDKRKYNVALVTLKAVGANGETPGTDTLDAGAKRVNPDVTTISAAMDDKVWIETITKAIESANNNAKVCPNNAFKIQKFTIIPHNFCEEKGELTPTKKIKRAAIMKAYAEVIDKLYANNGTYIKYGP